MVSSPPVVLAVVSSINTADKDFNVINTARAMNILSAVPTAMLLSLLLVPLLLPLLLVVMAVVAVVVNGMTPSGEGGTPPAGRLAKRVRPRCFSSRANDLARVPLRYPHFDFS